MLSLFPADMALTRVGDVGCWRANSGGLGRHRVLQREVGPMRRLLLGAVLGVSCAHALASDWVSAYEDFDEHYSLEVDSADKTPDTRGIVKIWARTTYQGTSGRLPNGTGYRRSLSRDFVDCANRRLAIGQVIYFGDIEQRRIVFTGSVPLQLVWHEVPPETAVASEVNFVCSLFAPKPAAPSVTTEKV